MNTFLSLSIALLPVLSFVAVLRVLDSYKLVPMQRVALSLAAGGAAALTALLANSLALSTFDLEHAALSRYVAPSVEEILKAGFVLYLVETRRVGFLVDAAIHGLAVGAGFAALENIYYYVALDQLPLGLWVLRGFGTATLHGCTTAILAILAKSLFDRHPEWGLARYLLPVGLAIGVHSAFNHFVLPPVAMTVLLIAVFPLLMVLVFERSERATHDWLGAGLDAGLEVLQITSSRAMQDTRIGRHLESLSTYFPAAVVADLLCYLHLYTELSVQAKGALLARRAGVKLPPDPEIEAKLSELRFLERNIGVTGRLAVTPFLQVSNRDIWQLKSQGY